jgi:hypothetical protein
MEKIIRAAAVPSAIARIENTRAALSDNRDGFTDAALVELHYHS